MKLSITDFVSKCDQTRSFLQIWSHLLKKYVTENFVFCAVSHYLDDLDFTEKTAVLLEVFDSEIALFTSFSGLTSPQWQKFLIINLKNKPSKPLINVILSIFQMYFLEKNTID